MDGEQHASVDPEVMHGTPRVAGTRIPVSVVLDNIAAGITVDELLAEYPSLTRETVTALLSSG